MKEKANEEDGVVSYEELGYCSMVLDFYHRVYNSPYEQFTDFLTSIKKFSQELLKTSKYYNLSAMIKAIAFSHDKFLEYKADYLDNSRSAVKIIDEVVKKTTVKLSIDENNKDKSRVDLIIYPEEGEKVLQ